MTINGDQIEIEGRQLKGSPVDFHNDHRIAMEGKGIDKIFLRITKHEHVSSEV